MIFIDLDNTIRDNISYMQKKYNFTENWTEFYGLVRGKTFPEYFNSDVALNAEPTEFGKSLLNTKQGYFILTAGTKYFNENLLWIKKWFGHQKLITVTCPEHKLMLLHFSDILIDDYPYLAVQEHIVFDQPYNQECCAKRLYQHNSIEDLL